MRRDAFLNLLCQTTRCSFLAQEKNSALGMLWHLLNPLAMSAVIYVVFSNISFVSSGIKRYPLYILTGLIHFNFFTHATTHAAEGMLNSRSLVLNTTVPLEILVLRSVCIEGLTYLIELALIALLVAFLGGGLTLNLFYYVFILLGMCLLTIGAAFVIASLVVFLTDLTYIWGVFTRMLFFLTPIFYSAKMVENKWGSKLIQLNPLAQMVDLGRKCLLDGEPLALGEIGWALIGPLVVLVFGWKVFQLTRSRIPDCI